MTPIDILIVDDDKIFSIALKQSLESKLPCKITIVNSLMGIREPVLNTPFAIAILDLHMPHVTGDVIANQLEKNGTVKMVFVITSDFDELVVERLLEIKIIKKVFSKDRPVFEITEEIKRLIR